MDILERINSYNYKTLSKDSMILLEFAVLNDDNLNEETAEKVETALKKAGFHVERKDGLIQMLSKVGKNISKIIFYAVQAWRKKKGAKEKLKETIQESKITRQQFLDFLLKLDTLSMHLFTGPIHMIDALTGWHIWPEISGKVKNMETRISNAIEELENASKEVKGKVKKKLKAYINSLKQIIGVKNAVTKT